MLYMLGAQYMLEMLHIIGIGQLCYIVLPAYICPMCIIYMLCVLHVAVMLCLPTPAPRECCVYRWNLLLRPNGVGAQRSSVLELC